MKTNENKKRTKGGQGGLGGCPFKRIAPKHFLT